MSTRIDRHLLRRGVSLVEAMVALAVMAFGMLALVGVQTTLRLNSDVARQRSEATIIATEEIERARNYATLDAVNASPGTSWAEISSRTVDAYAQPDSIGNTSYQVERTVREIANLKLKAIKVEVSWLDRTGVRQRVMLDTLVWGIKPELAGLLGVPVLASAANQVNGRDVTIPASAQDISGGKSRFIPPGSSGVSWIFTNSTGSLSVCDADGVSNCQNALLISGVVNFHTPAIATDPVTAANAERPQGPAMNLASGPSALSLSFRFSILSTGLSSLCYADSYTAAQLAVGAAPPVTGVNYYCAMLFSGQKGWGGQLNPRIINSSGSVLAPGSAATDIKVCRYTLANSIYTVNADHPKTYCEVAFNTYNIAFACDNTRVSNNLINQNFLVIPGDRSCPTDTPIDLVANNLVNSNTLQHQP